MLILNIAWLFIISYDTFSIGYGTDSHKLNNLTPDQGKKVVENK